MADILTCGDILVLRRYVDDNLTVEFARLELLDENGWLVVRFLGSDIMRQHLDADCVSLEVIPGNPTDSPEERLCQLKDRKEVARWNPKFSEYKQLVEKYDAAHKYVTTF